MKALEISRGGHMAGFVYHSMNRLEPFTSQHHTEKKIVDRYGVGK